MINTALNDNLSYHIRGKITECWLAETEGTFSLSRRHFWWSRGHDYLIPIGLNLLSNEVVANICCWLKFSAAMASCFVETDKEFIEELRNTKTKKVRTTGLKVSNNGQRWEEKMSNLKDKKYQRSRKLSITLPFMW